jgi:hypothetical protein
MNKKTPNNNRQKLNNKNTFPASTTPVKLFLYSERQKYGINSLKIEQNFFQKNLGIGQF